MSTYLELCQDVALESGTLAGALSVTTVQGATGRLASIAAWVRYAWTNIQNEKADWLWMRCPFEAALVTGINCYTPGDLGIERFAGFVTDRPDYRPMTIWEGARGRGDEAPISQVGYDVWRARYDRGTHDRQRPVEYAVSPRGELCVGATPDKTYRLRGEYRLTPQTLRLDADLPEMPERFHPIIVEEALRLMAKGDEAVTLLQTATAEGRALRFALYRDQLPRISVAGEPLA